MLANCGDSGTTPAQDKAEAPATSGPAPEQVEAVPESEAQLAAPEPDAKQLPPDYLGVWTGLEDSCADRSAELRLVVTPEQLQFYESVGTIRGVKVDGIDGFLVDLSFEGEGQKWSRKQRLALVDTGSRLIVTTDGSSVTRKRCRTAEG
jgi:hypothetical protein